MNRRTKTAVVALTVYLLSTLLGTAAASAAGTSQEQRVIAIFYGYDGVHPRSIVLATGVINAKGYETQSEPGADGVVHGIIHFPGGNLIITVRENHEQLNFNPTACSAAPTANGKFTITGGTGIYLGAKGSLTFTRSGYVIAARGANGACLADKAPEKSVAMLINGVGTITLKK